MKKQLCIFLAILMLSSILITGCGKEEVPIAVAQNTTVETTTEETTAETTTETTTEATTAKVTTNAPLTANSNKNADTRNEKPPLQKANYIIDGNLEPKIKKNPENKNRSPDRLGTKFMGFQDEHTADGELVGALIRFIVHNYSDYDFGPLEFEINLIDFNNDIFMTLYYNVEKPIKSGDSIEFLFRVPDGYQHYRSLRSISLGDIYEYQ